MQITDFSRMVVVIALDRVVQKVDNAIHRMNHYSADSVVCFVNTYPLDSDLPIAISRLRTPGPEGWLTFPHRPLVDTKQMFSLIIACRQFPVVIAFFLLPV